MMRSTGLWAARVAMAVAAVGLAGCVTPPQEALKKLSNIDSPIELGRAIAVEQSKSADTGFGMLDLVANPLVGPALQTLTAGQVYEREGYRGDRQRWCGGRSDIWSATSDAFAALCTRKGGNFDSGFCVKAGERDSVLFMAKVSRSQNSSCRAEVQITVAEPVASLQAPDYMAMLIKAGFETSAARQARLDAMLASQLAASRQQQEKADAERRRLAAELPQMKQRGTQICKDVGDTTWVGFVEDEANGKIKVLLSRGYVTRTPSMGVTLPSSNLVWEFPDRWRLC